MGKFSKGSGVKIGDPEGMFHSGMSIEAYKKTMMKKKWEIFMDKEVDNVAEIVRMFRSMDYVDRQLVRDLLQKIDLSDGLKVKKISPPQHQEA